MTLLVSVLASDTSLLLFTKKGKGLGCSVVVCSMKTAFFPSVLQETGIGKTVNSLRKHNVVGDAAKDLVGRWKKLVPQSADR